MSLAYHSPAQGSGKSLFALPVYRVRSTPRADGVFRGRSVRESAEIPLKASCAFPSYELEGLLFADAPPFDNMPASRYDLRYLRDLW